MTTEAAPEAPDFDAGAELEVPADFAVRDQDTANWVVRKIAEARTYQQRIREWAAREEARAAREAEWFLGRYGGELASWVEKQTAGGKRRSVALPAGVAGFRKQPQRVLVEDEAAVIAWAKTAHPELVVTVPATERIAKADLALVVKTTGEVPEGVRFSEERDEFYVK
jgi:hypothetical protein